MTRESTYLHGTHPEEQRRLSLLNDLTNASFIDFLEIKPGQSILEAGSGLGILANGVATRFPSSAVTGIRG
jgi:cyclopropane fatty-acyl-phospholipid synthase-like methyltransferase